MANFKQISVSVILQYYKYCIVNIKLRNFYSSYFIILSFDSEYFPKFTLLLFSLLYFALYSHLFHIQNFCMKFILTVCDRLDDVT